MTKYAAYVGEIENPCGFGDTPESAIAAALAAIREQGGIGSGPHQWADDAAVREVTSAQETDVAVK